MSLELFRQNKLYFKQIFDITDRLDFTKQLPYFYKPFYFNIEDDKDIWRYEAEYHGSYFNSSISKHVMGLNMNTKKNIYVPMGLSFSYPKKREVLDFRYLYRTGYLLNDTWINKEVKNNYYFKDLFQFRGLSDGLGADLSSISTLINLTNSRDRSLFPMSDDLDLRVSGFNGNWYSWSQGGSFDYSYLFPKSYFVVANNFLHSMSFFISSYDTPSIISPTLFFDSIAQKAEWNLKKVSIFNKFFKGIDTKFIHFYKNIFARYNDIFYVAFYSIIINYYYVYNYINNKNFMFSYNIFLFFIVMLKLWRTTISFFKYKYLKKFFKISVLKYFNMRILNSNYKTLFQENLRMNIFDNKKKRIRISKKKISLKLNNILLFNKVFSIKVLNNNTLTNNLLKYSLIKKIITKDDKNTEKLKKRLKKKLCKIKKENLSEVLCLHSEILDLQRIDKLGLNLWLFKNLTYVKKNYLEYLSLGRIDCTTKAVNTHGFVNGYMYKEIDVKYAFIGRYGFINKGWGDLSLIHKGSKVDKKNKLVCMVKKYTDVYIKKYKDFIKKIFILILQFIKLNYSIFFNHSKNFNRNYVSSIKKLILNYLVFIQRYKLMELTSSKQVKGIIKLDRCYFTYNFMRKDYKKKYKYGYLYTNNLIYLRKIKRKSVKY